MKSEDVLYEIKKIQQEEALEQGYVYEQMLTDILEPDNLYLLDEPEVSLSPQNQVKLAEEINQCARFLGCQFIIATHSPFMLGTLQAKIYNLESTEVEEAKWYELKNVQLFYEFFDKNRKYFER